VSHVDDRISPKMSVKPLDDESRPAARDAVRTVIVKSLGSCTQIESSRTCRSSREEEDPAQRQYGKARVRSSREPQRTHLRRTQRPPFPAAGLRSAESITRRRRGRERRPSSPLLLKWSAIAEARDKREADRACRRPANELDQVVARVAEVELTCREGSLDESPTPRVRNVRALDRLVGASKSSIVIPR